MTLGGASVGDHDLVQSALSRQGMSLGFWRVALRPGKPLMHGRLGAMALLGLPGNPVSSIVCGILFLVPAIRALLGDPDAGNDPSEEARLGADLAENDGRQDYLRATLARRHRDRPFRTGFLDALGAGPRRRAASCARPAPPRRERARPAESSASTGSGKRADCWVSDAATECRGAGAKTRQTNRSAGLTSATLS